MCGRISKRWIAAALVLALVAPAGAATAAPRSDDGEWGASFFAGGSVWRAVEAALERMGLFSSTSDPAGDPEPAPPVPVGDDGGNSVALDPSATSNLGPEMDPDG